MKRLKLAVLVVDIGVVRLRLLVILVASPLVLLPTSVADARSSKTLDIKVGFGRPHLCARTTSSPKD